MSKRILGIFAFIILCVIPFVSFGQNQTTTEKTEKVYYTIGGANESAGIDCFDYYRFGRKNWVNVSFNARNKTVNAGDTLRFLGQINNESNLPMLKLGVYAQLYRINNTKSAHFHGDYLVDEFFAIENISINASTTKALEFSYKIPQGLAPGKYVLGTSLIEDRQFNMAGVAFLDGTYAGRSYFEITNDQDKVSECYLEKDKIFINDVLYKQKDVTPDFFLNKIKDYTIKYSVKNISQTNQNVKITKTLYKWDNYSDKNKLDQKTDQAEIRADAYTLFEDKLPAITEGGVYLYEVIAETPTSKSRTAIRWSVNDTTSPARINFAGLSNFPLKKGDKAFIFNCFQSVSDFNRYEGKVVSILKDKSGRELVKTEYSSPDITSNIMAQKKDFDVDGDYRELILETTFYDKAGKIIDQSILNYDCSNFSTVLKKLDLDVKSGEIIVRPYDICEKPAESKLSIEVKDSDKTPIYVEAIAPTKEFRKKLDFKDGETYQIFAMASMKVMAKMEYTHHLTKSNVIIMYIIGVILALLVFVYIVSKKNKPVATIALFIFGILIAITPNFAKAVAPGAPALTGPGTTITGVPATGSWNSVTNATKYKWSIRSGSCSGTIISSGEITGTSVSIGASMNVWSGSSYYFCVQACNDSNECSALSSRNFAASINPTPSSPTNNGNLTDYNAKLDWTDSTGVYGYKYQVCQDSVCSTVLASGDVTASEVAIKNIDISTWDKTYYYWRVKACANSGYTNCMTNWSSILLFNNILAPTLVSPNNYEVLSTIPVELDWSNVTNAGSYEYEICGDKGCSSVLATGSTTASYIKVDGSSDIFNKYCYWHARSCATTDYKKCSKWSYDNSTSYYYNGMWVFGSSLPNPTMESPANEKVFTSMNPIRFSWSTISGIKGYEIRICSDSQCKNVLISKKTKNIYYDTESSLPIWDGNVYYWQVRSCVKDDLTSCAPYSKTRSFSTHISVPLISPQNEAVVNSFPIKLDWSDVSGAATYQYRICRYIDSKFDCYSYSLVTTGETSDSYYNVTDYNLNILSGVSYYFNVRACSDNDGKNCTPWSSSGHNSFYFVIKTPNCIFPKIYDPKYSATDGVFSIPGKFDWTDIPGIYGYKIRICSTYGCDQVLKSFTTQDSYIDISECKLSSLRTGIQYYWQISACVDENYINCGEWSKDIVQNGPQTGIARPVVLSNNSVVKINSLPSPPNGIDILSPPIIFDWNPISCAYGYQYYIKNNKTGERKEWSTTSNSVVINFENNVESSDWFHQSDDRGYEWGIRFCTDADLTKCGNANSSAWTKPSNFSVQRNLIKDAIFIDTQLSKRLPGIDAFYQRINSRGSVTDIFISANLTGIFSSTPHLVDFDSEEAREYDPIINVGDKIRLKLNKPEIGVGAGENVVTWVIRGGACDEPPAYWVDDAKKIYDNLTPLPSEYLYEATVNLGDLGTYYPKIGMAVTDPSKAWDKIEFKAFDASACMSGNGCVDAEESKTVVISKDSQGWYLVANQAGTVIVQAVIPDLDTVQTIDNKWFEMGKVITENQNFTITIRTPDKPIIDAGPQKTVFSGGTTRLDGQILYQQFMQASSKEKLIINPNFDPVAPPSATNVPSFPFIEDTNYIPTYFWECKKIESNGDVTIPLGNIVNQTDLSPMYIAEDTDVKCTVTMKIEKITTMKSSGDPSKLPTNIKDSPDLIGFVEMDPMSHMFEKRETDWQVSSDSTIVHILFNTAPIVKDLASQETNICNSGEKASMRLTWVYKDSNPTESKKYQIIITDSDNNEVKNETFNSGATAYTATGLKYDTTYTWKIIVWDEVGGRSQEPDPKDTFTTPSSRAPTVDFEFNKVNDPDNPEIIKYQFTDKSTVYSGTATYLWDFGDSTAKSNKQSPEHIYSESKQYTVTLTVSDGTNSCSISKDINAENEEYQYEEAGDINVFNQ